MLLIMFSQVVITPSLTALLAANEPFRRAIGRNIQVAFREACVAELKWDVHNEEIVPNKRQETWSHKTPGVQ